MMGENLSCELFRQLVENIDVGVMVDDSSGKIHYANQAFSRMFGLSGDQLCFFDFSELTAPEHRNELLKLHLHRLAGKPVPGHVDFTGIRTDGKRIQLQASVSMLQEEDSVYFLTLLKDVTSLRGNVLSEGQHRKAEMAGDLCRNILDSVSGYYRGKKQTPRLIRLLGHVSNLLEPPDFQRNDRLCEMDAGLMLLDTAGYLEERAHNKVRVTVSVDPDIPRVRTPALLVQQMLRNISDNALEAVGSSGHIRLSASGPDDEMSAGISGVQLQVSDDGPGMDEEAYERVGEPFFTTRDRALHRGLGLYQVFTGMSLVGGTAAVYSTKGSGTRVSLQFPVSEYAPTP